MFKTLFSIICLALACLPMTAQAQSPVATPQVAAVPTVQTQSLPTLQQLQLAQALVDKLSIPMEACRRQLLPEQLQNQVRLGRLDGIQAISKANFKTPDAKRWHAVIEKQRKAIASTAGLNKR